MPPAGARRPSSQSGAELSSSQPSTGLVSPLSGAGIYSPPKNNRTPRKRRAKALPFSGAGFSPSPSNTGLQPTNYRLQAAKAFTLIELLVVISIIGLLASVVVTSLGSARAKARDAKRRADLRQVSLALAFYFDDNNEYPPTATTADLNVWWGNCSGHGSHGTSGSNGWVPGLAPTYMPVLPLDPKYVGTGGCYLYRSDGKDYKLLAHTTMETSGCPPMPSGDGMWDPVRSGVQCTIGIFTPGAVGF